MPSVHYVLVADLLGFSQIVKNLDGPEQDERVLEWVSLCQEARDKLPFVEDHQLISDTVFAVAEDSARGLAHLIEYSQRLLERGIRKGLLVRGAIAHGRVHRGVVTHGAAISVAHDAGEGSNWVGVSLAGEVPALESAWGWDSVCMYPVPMSAGNKPVWYRGAVNWAVPRFEEALRAFSDRGLAKGGGTIPWNVADKIENTVVFGLYRAIGIQMRAPAEKNLGVLPIQVVEHALLHGSAIDEDRRSLARYESPL